MSASPSLINALTGRNALARTSHTPGRTQELIFFEGPEKAGLRLVDMPGYGYAAAPKTKVASWTALIHQFLQGRATLARVYVLIDARHGLKDVDHDVLKTLDKAAVSYQVVLTKADQVKPAELASRIAETDGGAGQTSGRLSERPGDILARRRRHAGAARRDRAAAGGAQLMMRDPSHADRARRSDGRRRRRAGGAGRARRGCSAAGAGLLDAAVSRQRGARDSGAGRARRRFMPASRLAAGIGFVLAAALFAGDLTMRHFAGHGLFPMAAPTGGTLLIASWLALALAAAWPRAG